MDQSNKSKSIIVTKPDKIISFFPFFYGYVVLIVGSIGKIMSSPGQSICIGVVIANMTADLNMSSTYCSILYFIGTTCSAFSLPYCGKIQAKLGQRISVTVISLGLGLSCIFFSKAMGNITVLLSFFMLRFFGQGNIMAVSIVQVNLWWVKNRGKMLGVANAVMSAFSIGVAPIFMNTLMENNGWRYTYYTLGFIELFFMLPLGFLFFRNSPESYGLLPDGIKNENKDSLLNQNLLQQDQKENEQVKEDIELQDLSLDNIVIGNDTIQDEEINKNNNNNQSGQNNQNKVQEINFTVQEMKQTSSFWVIILSQSIMALTLTAFVFHMRALFEIKGVSSSTVNMVYIFLACTSIFVPIITGIMIDKFQQHYLLAITLLSNCLAQLFMVFVQADRMYIVFLSTLLVGISMGMMQTLSSTLMAIYYGRKHISEIQTIMQSFMVLGSALGPLPFSAAYDYLGSYEVAFLSGACLPLVASYFVIKYGQKPSKPL